MRLEKQKEAHGTIQKGEIKLHWCEDLWRKEETTSQNCLGNSGFSSESAVRNKYKSTTDTQFVDRPFQVLTRPLT